jgi:hypothetical protein
VNETNCYNSSDLGFGSIYTITTQAIGTAADMNVSGASRLLAEWLGYLPLLAGAAWLLI